MGHKRSLRSNRWAALKASELVGPRLYFVVEADVLGDVGSSGNVIKRPIFLRRSVSLRRERRLDPVSDSQWLVAFGTGLITVQF